MPYLHPVSDVIPDTITELANGMLKRPVDEVVPVNGGGNNRVYRIDAQGEQFALKTYVRDLGDPRDRLGTEFQGLAFLNRCGADCVPEAIARDDAHGIGIYSWVAGSAVDTPERRDLDAAIGFVRQLSGFRDKAGADTLPLASEACLSVGELTRQIDVRFQKLTEADQPVINDFLEGPFKSARDTLIDSVYGKYAAHDFEFDQNLPLTQQTLSPSDFGFHNALRNRAGDLVFIDFEYFGWDDPAKLTADFLLHPGFHIDELQKRRFCKAAHELFLNDDPDFGARLRALYPLYALRWAMIMLNPFLPEWQSRRTGNDPAAAHRNTRRQHAQSMVMHALSSDKGFPYE
ncbi:MAG: phosphotransferase [Rhodospirillales bacterium]